MDKHLNIRQLTEENEKKMMSPFACLSANSKGRFTPLEEDSIRTCFQRDRDRIIHSKEFRRLKHKTQVFSSFEYNDHIRTRLTHTLEVSQVARTIAKALRLNEDLTEAISLGHDIGHCTFSHAGETVLNEIFKGFSHNKHSAHLAQKMNLSREVVDGILKHSNIETGEEAITLEGRIVKYADKFAYLNSDLDDGIRLGLITEEDIPHSIRKVLGKTSNDRLDTMIRDMILTSREKNEIMMSEEVDYNFKQLRNFMFERLYFNDKLTKKDETVKKIFYHIYETERESKKTDEEILEFMAGMTDSYAVKYFLNSYNINVQFLEVL
ncbi:MAG: HD domain-containing protein [Clostridia bacterium]|nr:HD domain-containing protein [Clostridia bacterium]